MNIFMCLIILLSSLTRLTKTIGSLKRFIRLYGITEGVEKIHEKIETCSQRVLKMIFVVSNWLFLGCTKKGAWVPRATNFCLWATR